MAVFMPNDTRRRILDDFAQIDEVWLKLDNAYATIKHRNAVSVGLFRVLDNYIQVARNEPENEKAIKYIELLEQTAMDYGLSRSDF